jgi:hypothetical protein
MMHNGCGATSGERPKMAGRLISSVILSVPLLPPFRRLNDAQRMRGLSAVETRRDYVRFSPGFLQSSELVIRIFSALPAFECAFLGARSLIWSKLCSDVLSKIREDFDAAGVVQSDEQILRVMNEFTLEAGNQVTRGGAPDALAVMLARQLKRK